MGEIYLAKSVTDTRLGATANYWIDRAAQLACYEAQFTAAFLYYTGKRAGFELNLAKAFEYVSMIPGDQMSREHMISVMVSGVASGVCDVHTPA